jgi:hypothetical protein
MKNMWITKKKNKKNLVPGMLGSTKQSINRKSKSKGY